MIWALDHPWLFVGLLGIAAFSYWAVGTRQEPHQLRAVFAGAPQLYAGNDVQVDGLDVGRVQSVYYSGGRAIVVMGLGDEFWPYHEGTTATLRFGTTVGNATRRVDLVPGPKSAPAIGENGVIPEQRTAPAVEFDQVFNVLNARTRAGLQQMLAGTGATFGPRAAQLGAGVQATAPALASLSGLAGDLAADEYGLRSLVAHGDEVTSTLAARSSTISSLVSGMGTTFATFSSHATQIAASLDRVPYTLDNARTTLARLDTSINGLRGLMTDLRPGAAQLAPLAGSLRPTLADLHATVPAAVSALELGTSAGPEVASLLRAGQTFASAATPALEKVTPIVACLRPYTPELAGLLGTWTSWNKYYDNVSHYGRPFANFGLAEPVVFPHGINSETFTKLTGQGYALVRPPGYDAGQPWFQPQCGDGPSGLNPADDPEGK